MIKAIVYVIAAIIFAYMFIVFVSKIIGFIFLRYCIYGVWLPAWIIMEERRKRKV